MNYRALGGGAIACSAIVVYGWAHPSILQGTNTCPAQLVENVTSLLTEKGAEQVNKDRCLLSNAIPTIDTAPEQIRPHTQQNNVPSTKLPYNVEQVYSQLLKQAHTAANSDRLAEAIASAASIPKNSQHYDMAQRLQEDWSQELLQRAGNCYKKADLSMALSMLNAIPQTSQRSARANELHDRWSQQARLLNQAIAAKEVGDWQGVMTALNELEGVQLYQSALVQDLLQQATSRAFGSDETLLRLASAQSSSVSTTVMPNMHHMASIPVNPPPSSDLRISVEQALEWVRPSAQSNIAMPSKAPKPGNAAAVSSTESSPIKSTMPVAGSTPAWAN